MSSPNAVAAVAALGALAVACSPQIGFECDSSAACNASPGGVCEIDRRCSYAADDCDSGRRYGSGAGGTAGECVDDEAMAGEADAGIALPLPPDGALASTCVGGDRSAEDPATGRCYRLFLVESGWSDARDACDGLDGHLAAVTSQAENQLLASLVPTLQGTFLGDVWIGASDAASEGTFAWVTAEPLGFTAWRAGEPNNLGSMMNEDCATVDAIASWNDRDCAERHYFICESD